MESWFGYTSIEDLVSTGLRSWWKEFHFMIQQLLHYGHLPLIVTFSKKMPRILQWLRAQNDLYLEDIGILDRCEIITSTALPFVSSSSCFRKMQVILVEDIVSNGISLDIIKREIKTIYQKEPLVSVLFKSDSLDRAATQWLDLMGRGEEVPEKGIPKIEVELISRIKDYWPEDMDFPIFKYRNSQFAINKLWDEFDSGMMKKFGCIGGGKVEDRINIVFKIPGQFWNNLDNSKLFCWKKEGAIVMEMNTTYIVAEDELLSRARDSFLNPEYDRIWRLIYYRLLQSSYINNLTGIERETVVSQTLVVMYNYLFALSDFIECMRELPIPERLADSMRLSLHDLRLIVGEEFVQELYPQLNYLIENQKITPIPPLKRIPMNDFFASSEDIEMYENLRINTVLKHTNIKDVVEGVFKIQSNDNDHEGLGRIIFKRFYGETFISLINLLKIRRSFTHIEETKVYEVIDDLIAQGKVVAKYERKRSHDAGICWRRYLHAIVI